jgi:hypothetical protein
MRNDIHSCSCGPCTRRARKPFVFKSCTCHASIRVCGLVRTKCIFAQIRTRVQPIADRFGKLTTYLQLAVLVLKY